MKKYSTTNSISDPEIPLNEHDILLPAGKDPIIRGLFQTNKRKSLFFICFLILICLLPLITSILQGSFIDNNLKVDAYHDLGYYIRLILILFFIFFLPHYFNGLGKAIVILRDSKILNLTSSSYKMSLDYSNRLFANRIVTLLPYIISVIFTSLGFITFFFAGYNYWNSSENFRNASLPTILMVFPMFLYSFLISAFLIRIVLTYFIIKKFVDDNVDIQPLHPDNCGGLSPLGNSSLRISSAGFGVGIPLMINVLWDVYKQGIPLFGYVEISTIIIYILSLTIVFFLPLLGARGGMLKARSKELKLISDRFQDERKRIILNIDSTTSSQVIGIIKLEELKKLYDIAQAMPIYPFNSRNVIRFFGSVLWPLLLILLQLLLQKI